MHCRLTSKIECSLQRRDGLEHLIHLELQCFELPYWKIRWIQCRIWARCWSHGGYGIESVWSYIDLEKAWNSKLIIETWYNALYVINTERLASHSHKVATGHLRICKWDWCLCVLSAWRWYIYYLKATYLSNRAIFCHEEHYIQKVQEIRGAETGRA